MKPFFKRSYYAVIIVLALAIMLPQIAASCIMSDNPCDCQARCTAACGYTGTSYDETLANVTLLITGTTGKFLATLLPLFGFYWAVRDKKSWKKRPLTAIVLWLNWLAVPIIALILYTHVVTSAPETNPLVGIVLWICFNIFFFWLYRRTMVWWKAALLPAVVAIAFGGTSIALALGAIDYSCVTMG